MARPLVKKHELITIGGLSAAEIDEMCANLEASSLDAVFPIPVTWIMNGLLLSSFVSQTTLLGICSEAGLSEELILSADRPTPSQTKCVFAVATDDVLLMSTASPGSTTSFAQAVEDRQNVNDQLDALVLLLKLGLCSVQCWLSSGRVTFESLSATTHLLFRRIQQFWFGGSIVKASEMWSRNWWGWH